MKQILISSILLSLFASCESPVYQSTEKGFSIPKGDPVVGEAVFRKFECYFCHSIEGIVFPSGAPGNYDLKIPLGGARYRVTSYGELVTAIIDPNHSVSRKYIETLPEEQRKQADQITSPMLGFNEDMTVQELIDLASFLHARYAVKQVPDSYFYPPHPF